MKKEEYLALVNKAITALDIYHEYLEKLIGSFQRARGEIRYISAFLFYVNFKNNEKMTEKLERIKKEVEGSSESVVDQKKIDKTLDFMYRAQDAANKAVEINDLSGHFMPVQAHKNAAISAKEIRGTFNDFIHEFDPQAQYKQKKTFMGRVYQMYFHYTKLIVDLHGMNGTLLRQLKEEDASKIKAEAKAQFEQDLGFKIEEKLSVTKCTTRLFNEDLSNEYLPGFSNVQDHIGFMKTDHMELSRGAAEILKDEQQNLLTQKPKTPLKVS